MLGEQRSKARTDGGVFAVSLQGRSCRRERFGLRSVEGARSVWFEVAAGVARRVAFPTKEGSNRRDTPSRGIEGFRGKISGGGSVRDVANVGCVALIR